MRCRTCLLSLVAVAAALVPSASRAQGVMVMGPAPMRTYYVQPTTTVVSSPMMMTQTAVGPTAYVSPYGAMSYYTPGRRVMTTSAVYPATTYVPTTTYVPRTTYVQTQRTFVDPAVAPVAYEKIKPNGKVKIVYPRQVYRAY
jgi:hypothetical protein